MHKHDLLRARELEQLFIVTISILHCVCGAKAKLDLENGSAISTNCVLM